MSAASMILARGSPKRRASLAMSATTLRKVPLNVYNRVRIVSELKAISWETENQRESENTLSMSPLLQFPSVQ